MSEWTGVATEEDIPINKSLAVQVDGVDVLLCNDGGRFVAVVNRCSHQDQPLTNGRIRNGYLFCPVHGMRFKLTDGEPIGQLTRVPLTMIETRVEAGRIQVRVTSDHKR